MDDLGEFGAFDLGEVFAAVLELLEGLDEGFCHAVVGFGRAAEDGELFGSCDTFVSVGIVETETKNGGSAARTPGFLNLDRGRSDFGLRGGFFARSTTAGRAAGGFVVG